MRLLAATTMGLAAFACASADEGSSAGAQSERVWVTLAPIPRDDIRPPDPSPIRSFRAYVEALARFESDDPAQWRLAAEQLAALPAGVLTEEERRLVAEAVVPAGAPSRRRLARVGRMHQAVLVFTGEFSAEAWDVAFAQLETLGPEAVDHLVRTLWLQLLQPYREPVWDHVRSYVVRTGEPGLRATRELFEAAEAVAIATEFNRVENELTRVYEVLLQYGDAGRPDLDRAVRHRHKNMRKPVAEAVANLGAGDRMELMDRLAADSEWEVRAAAVRALGRMAAAGGRAVELALAALKDPEPAVRQAAVEALVELRAPAEQLGPGLIAMLEDASPEVRARAAEALGRLGYRPALGPLLMLAARREVTAERRLVQLAAIEALGRLGDERAVDVLMGLLEARLYRRNERGELELTTTPDAALVNSAVVALQRITGLSIFAPEGWKDWYARRP